MTAERPAAPEHGQLSLDLDSPSKHRAGALAREILTVLLDAGRQEDVSLLPISLSGVMSEVTTDAELLALTLLAQATLTRSVLHMAAALGPRSIDELLELVVDISKRTPL